MNAPRAGSAYLKLLGSGEIVKRMGFSEITQLFEVESADGKRFNVQSNKVSQLVTPEEENGFKRHENT
ncbi:MAG: hypothetical protein ABSE48_20410 [Verrucomicrobiota bacterium]